METLKVADILVTQTSLRDFDQLKQMINFVRTGGLFDEGSLGSYAIRNSINRAAPRIEVARFEDGIMAIHNGHHRAMAIFLGRKDKSLHSSEFFIREWKYKDYTDIVLPHWVTPFDVINELRLSELHYWKDKVRKFYVQHGEAATQQFIRENKNQYSITRGSLYTVGDMSTRIKDKI